MRSLPSGAASKELSRQLIIVWITLEADGAFLPHSTATQGQRSIPSLTKFDQDDTCATA